MSRPIIDKLYYSMELSQSDALFSQNAHQRMKKLLIVEIGQERTDNIEEVVSEYSSECQRIGFATGFVTAMNLLAECLQDSKSLIE